MMNGNRVLRGFCLVTLGVVIGRWTIQIPTVSAQTLPKKTARTIRIGDVPLHLDSTQDSVLADLRKNYTVVDEGKIIDGSEYFSVSTSSYQSVGSVQFKQGKLAVATREWGDTLDAVSFFQKMYGAFESATTETKSGTVICQTDRGPDSLTMTIYIGFDGKSVTAYLTQEKIQGKSIIGTGVREGIFR